MKPVMWSTALLLSLSAQLAMGQTDSLHVLRSRLKGPIVGAHQGGIFGYWPNTMEAFIDAKNDGADVIEMDLRTSKDGVAVVFHDEKLDTWTNCTGKVQEHLFAELEKCTFRNSEIARIPSFEEVLRWANGNVVVDAEFKDSESIAPAIRLVQKYDAHAWTYFQAQGSKEKYQQAHALDSRVALLYAIGNSTDDLEWALNQDPALMIVEVRKGTRDPKVINAIHAAGKLTTEDAWHYSYAQELFGATCKKAFRNGIDIAISNRPKGCAKQK